MEILKIVERLEDYSRKIFAVMADEEFTETMSEAASLLIRQGEKIADLESKVAELEAQNRWIPVTERVPEENGRYLCNVKSFAFPGSFYQEILHYDKYGFREGHIYTDDVTHWMPLPEPPKEA